MSEGWQQMKAYAGKLIDFFCLLAHLDVGGEIFPIVIFAIGNLILLVVTI
jgi:hypothetical protein